MNSRFKRLQRKEVHLQRPPTPKMLVHKRNQMIAIDQLDWVSVGKGIGFVRERTRDDDAALCRACISHSTENVRTPTHHGRCDRRAHRSKIGIDLAKVTGFW